MNMYMPPKQTNLPQMGKMYALRNRRNINVPCSTQVPQSPRSEEQVCNTVSDSGHPIDASQTGPDLIETHGHRNRWTQEQLEEVMWCFYRARVVGGGSESDVFKIWRERNPELRPSFD